jgi:fumarate reductase subunit D
MAQSKTKPILWLLFSSGGTVLALVMPVIILLFGVFRPLGLVNPNFFSYNHMIVFFDSLLVKLIAFGILMLMFWHGGHRFYLTLKDLHIVKKDCPLAKACCYGSAIIGTIASLVVLLLV